MAPYAFNNYYVESDLDYIRMHQPHMYSRDTNLHACLSRGKSCSYIIDSNDYYNNIVLTII